MKNLVLNIINKISHFDLKKVFLLENINNDIIFFWHLLFSAFFFSAFFLFRHILISNTDVLNLNFPMLIFAKRNFLNGELGLWNPFVMSGTSSFLYGLAPIFSPDNWLQFIFPEKYFFIAGTFFSFVKLWLVGVFSYLIFYHELNSKKWAFFSSIIYQFCGYTIFAVTTYDVLSLLCFVTISLYIIWSMHLRKIYLNYVYLAIAVTLTMFSSNISYGAYSMIMIITLCLYRCLSQPLPLNRFRYFSISLFAILTGILIFMPRLLPVWTAIRTTNRATNFFSSDFSDWSFLGLRLFDPEVFGVCYRSSLEIIGSLSPKFEGIQIQLHMPQFFGVLPVLLILWAVITPQKGRINFWIVYVIVALSLILFIEPFNTIFRMLMYPAYHTLSMHIFLPIGFCMMAGYAAKHLEEKSESYILPSRSFKVFIF